MGRQLSYYCGAGLIFLALKWIYPLMDANDLRWLLLPTDLMLTFFSGSEGYFVDGKGYFHADLAISIEKSCSGFNFLLLLTIISYFVCLNYARNPLTKILLFPLALFSSYVLTIFVNASRISLSLFLQKLGIGLPDSLISHEAIGAFVYLFFLLVFYKTLVYFLTKYYPEYERLA